MRTKRASDHGAHRQPTNLTQEAVRGVGWTAAGQLLTQVLTLAATVVLARLLSPEDFGLLALVLVFSGFGGLLTELGLASALTQRDPLRARHVSTAVWLNVGSGLLLTAAFAAMSPALAALYGRPEVAGLALALSATFLLSIKPVPLALLQRQGRYKLIAQLTLAASVAGSVVSITAAVLGAGVWSLVAGSLTTTVVNSVLFVLAVRWDFGWTFERSAARELWSYGIGLVGFNSVNYWSRNADNFIVGRFAGAEALGLYSRAYGLMLLPVQQVTAVLGRVMFPSLVLVRHDRPRLRRAYVRSTRLVGFISFPLFAGLAAASGPVVLTLYGQEWAGMIDLLRILAIAGLPQGLAATVGWIYQTEGRNGTLFYWGLASSACTLLAFGIGIVWGVQGLAVAYAVRTYALLHPNFSIPCRMIGLPVSQVYRSVTGPLLMSVVMAACVAGVDALSSWSPPVTLLVQVLVGMSVYAAGTRCFCPDLVQELSDLRRGFTRVAPAGAG